jgi:hypothetical protein
MARRSPQTQAKRQREIAKADKRRAKEEKRAMRKSLKLEKSGDLPEDSAGELAQPDESKTG